MAISDLEQRLTPLEESRCWLPFGALRIPPWLEQEVLEEDPLLTVTRHRHRPRTWAGYCPHRLAQLVPEEPAGKGEPHTGDQSVGSGDGLPEGCTGHLQLPEPCKAGRSCTAAGIGAECVDSDCDTETPESRSSSLSSCIREEGDWESPFHTSNHGDGGDKWPVITTLMVQNLARTLTRRGLLDVLNGCGFDNRYDYVHLPLTFGTGKNKGFAFINFCSPEAAAEFARRFPQNDGPNTRDKMWHVAPAAVQGFEANATAAGSRKVARVRNNACRPLLLAPPRA